MSTSSKNIPTPEILLLPIVSDNLYLTILTGASMMKAGFAGVCKGRGKFPDKCFINPKTVEKYLPSSPESSEEHVYEFENPISTPFSKPQKIAGMFFGTSVSLDVEPDENMEMDKIEFCCDRS